MTKTKSMHLHIHIHDHNHQQHPPKTTKTSKQMQTKTASNLFLARQHFPHPLNFSLLLLRSNLGASAKLLPNHANKPDVVLGRLEEALSCRSPGVDTSPFIPDPVRLVTPRTETNFFDDGWGHNFLTAEDTPCDCVDVVGVHFDDVAVRVGRVGGERGLEVAFCVCSEPGEFLVAVFFEDWLEDGLEVRVWAEEFDEWLLENEAFALRTPAEDGVVASDAVDSWLGG